MKQMKLQKLYVIAIFITIGISCCPLAAMEWQESEQEQEKQDALAGLEHLVKIKEREINNLKDSVKRTPYDDQNSERKPNIAELEYETEIMKRVIDAYDSKSPAVQDTYVPKPSPTIHKSPTRKWEAGRPQPILTKEGNEMRSNLARKQEERRSSRPPVPIGEESSRRFIINELKESIERNPNDTKNPQREETIKQLEDEIAKNEIVQYQIKLKPVPEAKHKKQKRFWTTSWRE